MKKVLILTRSSEFTPNNAPEISEAISLVNNCKEVQMMQDKIRYHPVELNAFLEAMSEIDIHGLKLEKRDVETIKAFYSSIQVRYRSSIQEWKNVYFSKPGGSEIKFFRDKDLAITVTSIGEEKRRQLITDLQDFFCTKIAEKNKKEWSELSNVYVTFELESAKENIQVTLVLWDKLQGAVDFVEKEYRLGLVKAICSDCQINDSGGMKNGNILYIHDKQWGLLNKQVELFNQVKNREIHWNDEIITKTELNYLKECFSSASCFQHTGGEGSLFNNICKLNFDLDFIGRICDEVERVQVDIFKAKQYLEKLTVDELNK